MRSNAFWGVIFLILVVAGVGLWLLAGRPTVSNESANPTSQENTGNNTPATSTQSGPLTPEQLKARVVVDAPKSGAQVPKSFTITGKAPGPWFFEASFPIEVRSATGTLLTTVVATALTDWMTTDDVAFKAEVKITGYSGPATLVLVRDNPSGLAEHDASVSIPVTIQ